jgi:hypothetical protein
MRAPAVPDECVIRHFILNVSKTFKQVNIHKATGQTDYRDVSSKYAQINSSLTFSTSPSQRVCNTYCTCFKQTTIVTVPQKIKVTCLYDYRPVAFMLVAMKCFAGLVMAHIHTIMPDTLIPLQLAYLPNRSTDDAISITLHAALSHLDTRNTSVRMELSIQHQSTHKAHH